VQVRDENFGGIFKHRGDVHYILPRFQRAYAWQRKNWQTFWDDVIVTYQSKEAKPEHFMGAMVVVEEDMRDANMPTFTLVDGQQRLVTISVFLCALSNLVDDDLRWRIRSFLLNERREGDIAFKVLPTDNSNDKATWIALVNGEDRHFLGTRSQIPAAYEFFRKQLLQLEGADPDHLLNTIMNRLQIVFINLSREEKPHQIFESLNAKGVPLTQPDLVRNYIAMRLPEAEQERTFQNHWRPIEEMLIEEKTKESPGKEITNFLRHYLGSLDADLPNSRHIFDRFREFMQQETHKIERQFVQEIKTLHRFAGYYERFLRPQREPNHKLQNQLDRLKNWEVTVSYPFLLFLYDEYEQQRITIDDLLNSLSLVENYLVRRFLAGEPSAYLNKMFAALSREIDRSDIDQSLKSALTVRNYPSDSRLRQDLFTNQLYGRGNTPRLVFILTTINEHLSKDAGAYTVLDSKATVEHIMPQQLNPSWRKQLGVNADTLHGDYLHTLGNLTLVTQEWNSGLSNNDYERKKAVLSKHGLRLNSRYFSSGPQRWSEDSIRNRCNFLADQIVQIWPAFGESRSAHDYTHRKPTELTILGESTPVHSWKDMLIAMAEFAAESTDDFSEIAEANPRYFSQEPRSHINRWQQLKNGWWVLHAANANNLVAMCEKIAQQVGLGPNDWKFTIQN